MFQHNPNTRVVFVGDAVNTTYYPNIEETHCRFTVVVSKKISKLATERNRIKRIVYEVVRSHVEEFDHKYCGNMVFIVKKNTTAATMAPIKKDIMALLVADRINETNTYKTD